MKAPPVGDRPAKEEKDEPAVRRQKGPKAIHTVLGPLLFVLVLLLPGDIPFAVRCGIGLLLWMTWWWITRPVHLAVTGFLPLVVAAVFDFVPVGEILPSYSAPLIILLLSANIMTTLWERWGLDRRVALVSLIGVGTNTTRQIMVWFIMAMLLSAILPNTIVAATMIPIVVAMLRFIGIEDLWESRVGTALVLAVAWGTSAGGVTTPLGGAPNLLTVQFVEDYTGEEFLFITWLTRFLPLALTVMLAMLLFVRFVFRPEISEVPGSRTYFRKELGMLGRMSTPEKWGLAVFSAATLLAFTRPLYSTLFPSLTPPFVFLTLAIACFVIRHRGEPIITWEYAQSKMMWGLFYLFAGGTALGRILTESGTALFMADALVPYARGGGLAAVLIFGVLTTVMTQTTSNTAAVAVTVPITISTFQSLGMNPIPFIYIVTAIGNCGFVLPTSSGGTAVAAGYGVNLKTMFVKGLWASLLVLGLVAGVGYLLAMFWPAFGTA